MVVSEATGGWQSVGPEERQHRLFPRKPWQQMMVGRMIKLWWVASIGPETDVSGSTSDYTHSQVICRVYWGFFKAVLFLVFMLVAQSSHAPKMDVPILIWSILQSLLKLTNDSTWVIARWLGNFNMTNASFSKASTQCLFEHRLSVGRLWPTSAFHWLRRHLRHVGWEAKGYRLMPRIDAYLGILVVWLEVNGTWKFQDISNNCCTWIFSRKMWRSEVDRWRW